MNGYTHKKEIYTYDSYDQMIRTSGSWPPVWGPKNRLETTNSTQNRLYFFIICGLVQAGSEVQAARIHLPPGPTLKTSKSPFAIGRLSYQHLDLAVWGSVLNLGCVCVCVERLNRRKTSNFSSSGS